MSLEFCLGLPNICLYVYATCIHTCANRHTNAHTHDIFTLCENTHMGSYYPQCLLEKFYIGLHSLERAFVQEACRYLCSQISTRKTRNVKHSGLSSQKKETCSISSTQKTGDRTGRYPGDVCTSDMNTPH